MENRIWHHSSGSRASWRWRLFVCVRQPCTRRRAAAAARWIAALEQGGAVSGTGRGAVRDGDQRQVVRPRRIRRRRERPRTRLSSTTRPPTGGRKKKDMPVHVHHQAQTPLNGKLYVFGGCLKGISGEGGVAERMGVRPGCRFLARARADPGQAVFGDRRSRSTARSI